MEQPKGFSKGGPDQFVCKLKRFMCSAIVDEMIGMC